MTRAACAFVVTIVACAFAAHAATTKQVDAAIAKAKTWLYKQQLADGTWEIPFEEHGDQKTGQTALVLYALMSAGESRQDPRLAKAIEYLKKTDTTGVYALGLRCQVWLMLPPTLDVRGAMTKDSRILQQSIKRSGEGKGFYDYNPEGGNRYSHSRAQYAVLGLWAASQSGIEIPREYWQLVEKSWIEHQDPGGGWNYGYKRESFPITPGMTAVGVATLFITQDFLHGTEGLSGTSGNVRNPAIERGMKWLADNFSKVATDEKYPRDYPYATLYAIERVGVTSGQKFFGNIDWYEKGSDWLLKQQRSDGSFPIEYGVKTASTCFATLFLARGSAPLMMNKLDYSAANVPNAKADDPPHWNQRPRDAANIARWVGRQIERDLNWQIVNLDASVDDLHDAPILYLAGNQDISLTPEQEAKLKQFVEEGGFIVANADASSANFITAFQRLGKKLFPAYAFAPLPDNHAIYANQQFARSQWKRKPSLQSLGNGAREFMILLADSDPAKAWQMQQPAPREELFQLAADVFQYAIDKQNLRRRGESYVVRPNEKVAPTQTMQLARLQYNGNWDPEPGGWRRLAAVLRNESKMDLKVEAVMADKLSNYKLAHLTGTGAISFDPTARAAIKQFIDSGGTLIIDAAGGSTDFAKSAETELAAIFPEQKDQLAEPLPPDHPLYGKLKTFGYRPFARKKLGLLKSPQLRGITIAKRLAVIYSREDLSVGLVGQPVDGIVGYDPDTATALMTRAILLNNPQK